MKVSSARMCIRNADVAHLDARLSALRDTHTHGLNQLSCHMEQQHRTLTSTVNRLLNFSGLFFSRPRSEGWPHHGRTFSIYPCRSGWLLHGKSCPRLDVVHPGRAWPSSPACILHCSLHYLFLQATPLFPHGVTIVC